MIQVSRLLLRQFHSVLRRAGFNKTRSSKAELIVRAAADGLRIQAISDQIALEYHQLGQFDVAELVVPSRLLPAAEGRTAEAVTLAEKSPGRTLANWTDHGIPQVLELVSNANANFAANFPTLPEQFVANAAKLGSAMQDAASVAGEERTRYALHCLQINGSAGKIAATDGRQVLVQSGFQFPWAEALLVPASPVFAARELPQAEPWCVGIIPNWVVFRSGPWTIWLRIEQEAQFPKIDDLIRSPLEAVARLSIEPADGRFLLAALAGLPSDDPAHQPITLDLNGQVMVRAQAADQPRQTELILSRSKLTGESLSINTSRDFLARAIKLGFAEVCFFARQTPALCDDGRRQYLWAVLDADSAWKASKDAIRIESTACTDVEAHASETTSRRRINVDHTKTQSTQPLSVVRPGPVKRSPDAAGNVRASITQAVALRACLREVLGHANELIRALKREKRQGRLVASTLASLKQLQKVAG